MTKKTLKEASQDIFNANRASKGLGEPFGANKGHEGNAPQPAGQEIASGPTDHGHFVGGPVVDPAKNGGNAYIAKAPHATPPGTPPADGSNEKMLSLKAGTNHEGKKRVKVNDSGIAEEEVDESSESQTMLPDSGGIKSGIDTAKPISDTVKAYFAGKQGIKGQIAEDIKSIFDGQNLSEDFVRKATFVFEAAVIQVSTQVCEGLEAEYIASLTNITEAQKAEMATKLDEYMDYMSTKWLEENKIAVEQNLKTELSESFMGALHKVFLEHFIDVPTDKIQVVEQLADEVESLNSKLNEAIEANLALTKQITESAKADVISQATAGLTDAQAAKVKSLAESVDFKSVEEFKTQVNTLKTTLVEKAPVKKPGIDSLNESTTADKGAKEPAKIVENTGDVVPVTNMDRYLKVLTKQIK